MTSNETEGLVTGFYILFLFVSDDYSQTMKVCQLFDSQKNKLILLQKHIFQFFIILIIILISSDSDWYMLRD